MFKRKIVLWLLTVVTIVVSSPFIAAAQTQKVQQKNTSSKPTGAGKAGEADAKFQEAIDLVQRGKRFEEAAGLLQTLVREYPQNSSYHVALACACAGRAASLAYADHAKSRYEKDLIAYQKAFGKWQQAQTNTEDALHGTPPPATPILHTPDDNIKYQLTHEQMQARFETLYKTAKTEWDAGVSSSKDTQEKQDARFTRAWGLLLFRRYLRSFGVSLPLPPELDDITTDFEALTKERPGDAGYWQSLGDAYLGGTFLGSYNRDVNKAIAAYQKSLALQKNSTLALQLSDICLSQLTGRPNKEAGIDALRLAVAEDNGNGFLGYRLAFQLLLPLVPDKIVTQIADTEAPRYAEAVHVFKQANRASRFELPMYQTAAPELLQKAWSYPNRAGGSPFLRNGHEFTLLPRKMDAYALFRSKTSENEAVEIAEEVKKMGYHCMSLAENQPKIHLSAQAKIIHYNGVWAVIQGQQTIVAIYKEREEKEKATQAYQDYVTLAKMMQQKSDAVSAAYNSSYGTSY